MTTAYQDSHGTFGKPGDTVVGITFEQERLGYYRRPFLVKGTIVKITPTKVKIWNDAKRRHYYIPHDQTLLLKGETREPTSRW